MTAQARTQAPARRELVITRVFDAPRDIMFMMWTDPKHVAQWWGPRNYPASEVSMDVRPGGRWRDCLRSTEGGKDLWLGGTYREIVPPERLVFTFAWEEEGERGLETLVTVTFAEEGSRTRMTFRQTPFESDGERDGHNGGWNSSFDRLAEQLAVAGQRSTWDQRSVSTFIDCDKMVGGQFEQGLASLKALSER